MDRVKTGAKVLIPWSYTVDFAEGEAMISLVYFTDPAQFCGGFGGGDEHAADPFCSEPGPTLGTLPGGFEVLESQTATATATAGGTEVLLEDSAGVYVALSCELDAVPGVTAPDLESLVHIPAFTAVLAADLKELSPAP